MFSLDLWQLRRMWGCVPQIIQLFTSQKMYVSLKYMHSVIIGEGLWKFLPDSLAPQNSYKSFEVY